MEGFIKLHKQMVDWQWYKDNNTKCLFIDLLLDTNFEESKSGFLTIKKGQVLTSLKRMSERTGLSYQEIRTSLSKLVKSGEINKQSTSANTIITINNWCQYQNINKRATNEQQTINNIKEYKEYQEEKEYKKLSKDNIYVHFDKEFDEVWSLYPRKEGKSNAKKSYIKAREKGVTKEKIIEGINNYIAYLKFNNYESRYTKMGSTWFNQECWNDIYNLEKKISNKNSNVFAELLEEETNGTNNSFINAEYTEKSIS